MADRDGSIVVWASAGWMAAHLLVFTISMPDGQLDACRRRRQFVGIKIVNEAVIEKWTEWVPMDGRALIAASISLIVGAN